jgi:glycosyltransferase involved in cell wall biosynthesis
VDKVVSLPSITVAICTAQRYDLLERLLKTLEEQEYGRPWEVLVVDNTPAPDRCDIKTPAGLHRVRVVFEDTLGLSHARNRAIAESESDVIAFVDDDALVDVGWLSEVGRSFALSTSSPVGVVGGPATPLWEVTPPAWLDALPASTKSLFSLVDWSGKTRVATASEWFVGANIAFARDALLAVGGFGGHLGRVASSAALLSNEEVDAAVRVEAAGYVRVWNPDASVQHQISADRMTIDWMRRRVFWQIASDALSGTPFIADVEAVRSMATSLSQISRGRLRGLPAFFAEPESAMEAALQLDLLSMFLAGLLFGTHPEEQDGEGFR